MRGLTVFLVDPDRLEPALALLMAQAALGAPARLHAHGHAVTALAQPMLADAIEMGVEVTACSSGLADTATDPGDLDPRIVPSGPVGLLQGLDGDRLLAL